MNLPIRRVQLTVDTTAEIFFTLNSREVELLVDAGRPLLSFLRSEKGLIASGTHDAVGGRLLQLAMAPQRVRDATPARSQQAVPTS